MNSNKARLSKSILEMKFMKRTKEKVEKQQFQEEGEEYFGNEITKLMKKESDRFIIEPSYIFCENLIDGRVSYQGMNPEVEKLMELEQRDQNKEGTKLELEKETDVSDTQMADHWKPFQKKVKSEKRYEKSFQNGNNEDEPIKKKPKFLKPQD